jgi:hypothetical protein
MKVVFCTHLRGVYTSLFRSTQHPMLMDFAAEFERLALSFFEPCDRAADNLSIIGREYEPDVSRSTSLRTSAYMVSYDRYQWIIPRVVTIPKLTRIYILAVLSQRSNAPNPTNPLSPYLLQGYTPKDTCIVSLQHTPWAPSTTNMPIQSAPA